MFSPGFSFSSSLKSLLRHAVAAAGFGLAAMSVVAAPANPVDGVDYRTLAKPQQTDSGKKVEVTEFFWYACPHCHAFDPSLSEWVKKQGNNIVFKRVPVQFRDTFIPQQKLYYALESMGKLEELHGKIFTAIHGERQMLETDAAVMDFVVKNGIDRKKFEDAYKSFGVQSKVQRAKQLQGGYQIDGVPMVAIDGRFLTSPSIVGASMRGAPESALHAATLQVMDVLVARATKEQKSQVGTAPKMAEAPGGTVRK